ncbi:LegC family aminotransferase [Kribbella jejuensis]|uniref:dTDP-4-amino-4,6-dideoxygalactose transaminase n=1 Tax=Kribbella jejuensis TaxID=236068 RepID=A0A542ERQ6_9ACTN|nr:DegT/DnrJ/EryC1/StrS family aminotransferase [Kribbella jejuensis]TQJ18038.1 dTDP-4-amino-4,6-dideoxygalactose transaminase [Kribbella jejuensis]
MIPLSEPTFGGNEAVYLEQCLVGGYVSSVGPFVDSFERQFAAWVGSHHAVACASGTAALHVALQIAGAAPGRLVAVSDFTFIASVNAVHYTGADLLLVDSEPRTWNMNTELLRDRVVRRAARGHRLPDLVEIVHVLGHPADIEPLLELRERFGIRIIEDAAESLGASWHDGRLAGTVGDLACFSFNGNKIITTGSGGMITTNDATYAARAKHLTTQAKVPASSYLHDEVGYNYRLSNLSAALGIAQLEQLADRIGRKRQIALRYAEQLEGLPLTLPPHATWANPTYWLYSVLLDEAAPENVVARLSSAKVEARRVWRPVHLQPPYATAERLLGSVAEAIHARGLSLPSSSHLTAEQQRRVSAELGSALAVQN